LYSFITRIGMNALVVAVSLSVILFDFSLAFSLLLSFV
jgi:hypothetical protein